MHTQVGATGRARALTRAKLIQLSLINSKGDCRQNERNAARSAATIKICIYACLGHTIGGWGGGVWARRPAAHGRICN